MNPNISRNLSDRDLSTHLGSVHGKGGLYVKFFYARVKLQTVDPEMNGKLETRLCVAKQPIGDKYTIAHSEISEEQARAEFPHEFAMFKEYEDVPTSGTPLHELPGISQSQIALLTLNGLRSVEDMVHISEDQATQLGMEVSHARALAVKWLDRRDGGKEVIDLADMEARFKAQNDEMERKIAALTQNNLFLQSRVDAGTSTKAGAVSAEGPQPMAVDDGLSHKLDPNDGVFGGGDMATGNDDLNADENPLA